MDFVILLLTGKLLKLTYRLWRLIVGSMIGAVGACLFVVERHMPVVLEFIVAYVVLTILMVLVSYGRFRLRKLLFITMTLYGQTIFIGGFLQFLDDLPTMKNVLNSLVNASGKHKLSLLAMFLLILGFVLLSPYLFRWIHEFQRKRRTVFSVTLCLEGKKIVVNGLLDTGNRLREPISNKPVIIVEQRVLDEIMTKDFLDYETRIKLIPYRSIGKDSGTMCGLVLDELTVEVNEEQHVYKNVIAGLYKGILSGKKEYQVILHEELT